MAAGTGKSGQQVAAEHAQRLADVLAGYADKPLPRTRGRLNLSRLATECAFDRKVFQTNPRCKKLLVDADQTERTRLPSAFERAEISREDLSKENKERAALEAEILTLRVEISSLQQELRRYKLIEDLMLERGRLP